ncbi:MAG TPA: NTP transferase domain-containing protein [Solirubrobacteraceae bacterium]|nr:NTP transferase domain-containing protein [Solirubrobacteraceae bacterium]
MVVLAAGRGSRLSALAGATPKWLLRVGGRTIADRHLEGIARAAHAVAGVHVVTGHAAGAIARDLARRPQDVAVVPNPEFTELNNWWSLLLALRKLPPDGPVVVLNADLLAEPEHLAAFIGEAVAGPADGLLAVDLERAVTDESMKVARRPDGALRAIGKVGIDDPAGEYVGLLMARGPVLRRMRAVLETFVGRPSAVNEWYEAAVARTAAEGAHWQLWSMPSGRWIEIDDDDDLSAAEALAGGA